MFGAVNEDFYGLVGRVALVATLLEDRLHVLFCALASAPQDRLAGATGTTLIKECGAHLDRFPAERRDEARAVLADAEAALRKRHEVIHSLWPFTGRSQVRGWRNVPKSRRQCDAQPVEWTSLHAEQLLDLLTNLVNLVDRCRQAELWVPPPAP